MYILKFTDINCYNPDMFFQGLAEFCHMSCPTGILPCPFNNTIACNDITKEDWMNIFQEVKE